MGLSFCIKEGNRTTINEEAATVNKAKWLTNESEEGDTLEGAIGGWEGLAFKQSHTNGALGVEDLA